MQPTSPGHLCLSFPKQKKLHNLSKPFQSKSTCPKSKHSPPHHVWVPLSAIKPAARRVQQWPHFALREPRHRDPRIRATRFSEPRRSPRPLGPGPRRPKDISSRSLQLVQLRSSPNPLPEKLPNAGIWKHLSLYGVNLLFSFFFNNKCTKRKKNPQKLRIYNVISRILASALPTRPSRQDGPQVP